MDTTRDTDTTLQGYNDMSLIKNLRHKHHKDIFIKICIFLKYILCLYKKKNNNNSKSINSGI